MQGDGVTRTQADRLALIAKRSRRSLDDVDDVANVVLARSALDRRVA
jgi:hypothetical protein